MSTHQYFENQYQTATFKPATNPRPVKKFIYLAAILGIVTLICYCRSCKPALSESEIKERQVAQTIQALNRRIAVLVLDSLTIRNRMQESADSFKMAINAKKAVYSKSRKKAKETDFRKSTSPVLDSVVNSLYPDQAYIDTANWETKRWKAGLLVTDAVRSYYQDTALTVLEEIVNIQAVEKDSLANNYEKLLTVSTEKYEVKTQELDLERTLKQHFKAEAEKYKRQRNRILMFIGGAVVSGIGGAVAYNKIKN